MYIKLQEPTRMPYLPLLDFLLGLIYHDTCLSTQTQLQCRSRRSLPTCCTLPKDSSGDIEGYWCDHNIRILYLLSLHFGLYHVMIQRVYFTFWQHISKQNVVNIRQPATIYNAEVPNSLKVESDILSHHLIILLCSYHSSS